MSRLRREIRSPQHCLALLGCLSGAFTSVVLLLSSPSGSVGNRYIFVSIILLQVLIGTCVLFLFIKERRWGALNAQSMEVLKAIEIASEIDEDDARRLSLQLILSQHRFRKPSKLKSFWRGVGGVLAIAGGTEAKAISASVDDPRSDLISASKAVFSAYEALKRR